MAEYGISGVCKGLDGVITHYIFNEIKENSIVKTEKVSKRRAILLLKRNTAKVLTWDYQKANWIIGESVIVVNESYLRSNPDNKKTDNLDNLINYNLGV